MPRIRQLDASLINKIAAGEVIERPASVVKELLENSLDALATRIEVDIADGGAELIRIVDDGEGIHPDDLPLAVTSHATSKIETADDLFRVRTMGFRGEALASIASVSRFRIRSRQPDSATGYELEVNAGRVGDVQPCGGPVGTLIEIRQLFANTPVRRKFLKSTATEFGHISEQFTRIALANPRLHAVLRHNNRTVFELPACHQILERLRLFFGAELAESLIWVESKAGDVRLWGFVGHPELSKSTRKGQYLFLNGRWIQDRSLQHALTEAYRGLLMVGRQPISFLFLEMPPDLVDVNVHPTKSEVRFRDSQQLYRQMLSTLRTKFLGMDLGGTMRVPASAQTDSEPVDPQRRHELQLDLANWAKDQLANWSPDAPPTYTVEDKEPTDSSSANESTSDERSPLAPRVDQEGGLLAPRAESRLAERVDHPHAVPTQPVNPALGQATPPHTDPRVLQVHDCYLVLETPEGLAVIDQHALHERVMYEQLRRRVLAGAVESQRLLVPETIEMSPAEATLLLEQHELLTQLGFGLEEFGRGTLLLTAYPSMLARADHVQLVRDIAEQIAGAGQKPTRRDILDSLLHMMSCKAAIKAGQRLTPEEMESLLAQRHLIDDAHHCPHGRPTALVLSRAELDRQFGRLG